jgi:hypothetical protein
MSISTYFKPNVHQNGPEILGVKTPFTFRYLAKLRHQIKKATMHNINEYSEQ